ncbi:MAG: alpha/beta fold hydrolase [Tissierellia bacterium]|nr:alpha/beta fold hydrolase [Tissierellia bacterium]
MRRIVLVHGYNKTSKDMKTLKTNLEKMGHFVHLVDLPLTFRSIDDCVELFSKQMEGILSENMDDNDRVSLVGHSSGGLVIQLYLRNNMCLTGIARCVLIATPNKGTRLADIAVNLFKPAGKVFKTLNDLTTANAKKSVFDQFHEIEIGAIAGNNCNLLLGRLLENENDGRVEVNSVRIEGLQDFIVLPYGHKEIHYQYETAKLVSDFVRKGFFVKN